MSRPVPRSPVRRSRRAAAREAARHTAPVPARRAPVPWVIPLLLVVIPLAVFGQVLGFAFLRWDDPQHLWENPHFQPLTVPGLAAFWQQPYWGLFIPVTYTVWGLTAAGCQALGLGAFPSGVFHALNLLTHLANGLLVAAILRLLLARTLPDVSAQHRAWAACGGALLWAVHPLQAEPVAWVSGLKDTLAGSGALLAIWLALRALQEGRHAWHWLATGAFLAAVLAKPAAVSVPLMAAVLGAWGWPATWRRQWWLFGGGLLLAAGVGLLTRQEQTAWLSAVGGLLPRLAVAGDAVTWYLVKLVVPLELGLLYGRTPATVLAHATVWLTGLAPWALLGGLWGLRHRWPVGLVAAGVFVAGLGPTLGLISFAFQFQSTVADRYAYLALLGPSLALAWGVARVRRRGLLLGVAVALTVLAGRSAWQTHQWRTREAIATQTLRVNPAALPAHLERGLLLQAQGRVADAAQYVEAVLRTWPSWAEGHYYLGTVLVSLGRRAEARDHFATAIRLQPGHVRVRYNLAALLEHQGQAVEAITHLQAAIRLQPRYLRAYPFLAKLLRAQGREGDAQAAEAAAQRGGLSRAETHTASFLQAAPHEE